MKRQKARISKEKQAEWRESIRIVLLEAVILFVILSIVTIVIYIKYPGFTEHFRSVAAFQSFMHAHRDESYLFYIGLQVLLVA